MKVFLQVSGDPQEVVAATTALGRVVVESGRGRMFMDDPEAIAKQGRGGIAVELPDLDDEDEAQSVVRALVDQVGDGSRLFSFDGRP